MKKLIENKFIENIKSIIEKNDELSEVKVIAADDFSDERDIYMVVVGITDETNVNPGLDDYEYKLSIVVDTFITDDEKR